MYKFSSLLLLLTLFTLAGCGSDSSSRQGVTDPLPEPVPEFDFSTVDESMQRFLD